MDSADFILPWLMHSAGHLSYGNQASGGARLNVKDLSEKWDGPVRAYHIPTADDIMAKKDRIINGEHLVPIYDEKPQAKFGGSGFEVQDEIGRIKNSPSYNIGNALSKMLYLLGSYKLSNSDIGDIKQIERNSGNNNAEVLLMLSSAADLAKAAYPEANADMRFRMIEGKSSYAPGLVLSVPLDADMKPVWSSKRAGR